MKKLNLITLSVLILLSSCQSRKNKSGSNVARDKEINLQYRFENNIYPINEKGEDDSVMVTLTSRMNDFNVPGLSITVFDNNEILWSKGYGVKDKNSGKPVTENTLFQAASISKPVTSVAAFKLIEENKFSLDENVNSKLIRWQIPDNKFTKNEKVTARRIMSHTSGLGTNGFEGYKQQDSIPTLKQILQGSEITNSEPVRVIQKPGESEIYSGGGMTVLQMLMEDITGKEFSDLMNDLVLNPMQMHNSSFEYPLPERFIGLTSIGYDEKGNAIDGGYHIYPEKAAAGLWSTSSDLARFMIALGKSYRGEENSLLKQSSAQIMMTRVPNAGGIGIGIDGEGEAFRFRHSGGNAGFSCYAVSFANKGRGVVIMTNSDNGFHLIHEIVRAVAREYNWPPMFMRE
ncbi:MAG TPA: serine hydrolase domain-containing protein [Draconibacterium sp.]|nr:serine hydrolase domain-containing protein [Draconibacterium sp.]